MYIRQQTKGYSVITRVAYKFLRRDAIVWVWRPKRLRTENIVMIRIQIFGEVELCLCYAPFLRNVAPSMSRVKRFSKNTNKMQLCNRIYYSIVYWRLNMFRAAHRSSSGALTVFADPLVYIRMWWPAVVKSEWELVPTQTWLRSVTTCVCKPEAANTVRAPDDERCTARNMLSCQWTVE